MTGGVNVVEREVILLEELLKVEKISAIIEYKGKMG